MAPDRKSRLDITAVVDLGEVPPNTRPLPVYMGYALFLLGRASGKTKTNQRDLAKVMKDIEPKALPGLSAFIGRMLSGGEPKDIYERVLRDALVTELKSGLLLVPKRPTGGRPKRDRAPKHILDFIQEGLDRHEKLDAVYKAAEQRFELSNRQIRRIWAKRGQ